MDEKELKAVGIKEVRFRPVEIETPAGRRPTLQMRIECRQPVPLIEPNVAGWLTLPPQHLAAFAGQLRDLVEALGLQMPPPPARPSN